MKKLKHKKLEIGTLVYDCCLESYGIIIEDRQILGKDSWIILFEGNIKKSFSKDYEDLVWIGIKKSRSEIMSALSYFIKIKYIFTSLKKSNASKKLTMKTLKNHAREYNRWLKSGSPLSGELRDIENRVFETVLKELDEDHEWKNPDNSWRYENQALTKTELMLAKIKRTLNLTNK